MLVMIVICGCIIFIRGVIFFVWFMLILNILKLVLVGILVRVSGIF